MLMQFPSKYTADVSNCSLGVLLTFFSVKHSFALTVVTYGAVFGFGVGITYAIPLGCVMRVS